MASYFFKTLVLLICVASFYSCQQKRDGDPKILVFTTSDKDSSNANSVGAAAIMKLGVEHKFDVDTTSNAARFIEDSLKNYAAVVMLNTSGNTLDKYQEVAFERYIQAGGGVLAIQSIKDTEVDWGWYQRLFSSNNSDDLSQQEIEGGRVASLQKKEAYSNSLFSDKNYMSQLLQGIEYVVGKNYVLDYKKAKAKPVPTDADFTKVTMAKGELFEPTEMAILPDLSILIAQRRGELLLLDQKTSKVEQVGFLDVYHETGNPKVNAEEGFMGLTLDPDFEKNNYIYAFYSPKDTSVNR